MKRHTKYLICTLVLSPGRNESDYLTLKVYITNAFLHVCYSWIYIGVLGGKKCPLGEASTS